MKSLLILLLSLSLLESTAQSYEVDWRVQEYDTLTNYSSILYELLSEPSLNGEEYEIDFGFTFPYFDQEYSSIIMDGSGYGYFEDNTEDYNFFIFAGDFERHYRFNLFSDWRFRRDTIGIDILKIEWRNVGIYDDITSPTSTYHYINMQVWLYQNGIIEYHFGDINLANSPFYDSESGFIWDDGESYGPWIGIQNSLLSEMYYITGTNFNTQVVTDPDEVDIFYDIPPAGRVFRFLPDELVNTENIDIEYNLQIYPVPAKETFYISCNNCQNKIEKIDLLDGQGRILLSTTEIIGNNNSLDISHLTNGCYFIRIQFANGKTLVRKVLKN